MTFNSFQMKQMVFLSIGCHLLLLASLFMIHLIRWSHPVATPKALDVRWVTLPQNPPEPAKKIEPAPPLPILPKKNTKLQPVKIKPLSNPPVPLPKKVLNKPIKTPLPEQPVQKKIEEVAEPPRIETKKENPEPSVQPQKIEIAPISEIDPSYLDRIKRSIDMNFNPPLFNGNSKEVTVSFEVLKSGMIKNPKIVKSSKDSYFDMAALRAIFESRRFGQLPADYPSLSVEITCTFSQNKGS
jgi:TonB family protein